MRDLSPRAESQGFSAQQHGNSSQRASPTDNVSIGASITSNQSMRTAENARRHALTDSDAPRPRKRARATTADKQVTEGQVIHENFPTVLMFDGVWLELHCSYFGGNASRTDAFFRGLGGFSRHMKLAHWKLRLRRLCVASVNEHCEMGNLSSGDVKLLKQGRQARDSSIELVYNLR